jgi:ATP-dependent DNA helicase PIF1
MPFRLAYALTIHKSQGQTLSKAVIALGKKEQTLGLTHVALSRLRPDKHSQIGTNLFENNFFF